MRLAALLALPLSLAAQSTNWTTVGTDQNFSQHSPLKQIHRPNIHKHQRAWTDVFEDGDFQRDPIVTQGIHYASHLPEKRHHEAVSDLIDAGSAQAATKTRPISSPVDPPRTSKWVPRVPIG